MKTPDEFKKNLIACMDEAIDVAENGDAHDLLDFADHAHARMSETLTYIQQLEAEKAKTGEKLLCQITIDGEEILRKALDKMEVDGKTVAEWIELAKGYEQLESELEATKRERDAAVADLAPDCCTCKHKGETERCRWSPCGYEWRGVCPENTEVQDDG